MPKWSKCHVTVCGIIRDEVKQGNQSLKQGCHMSITSHLFPQYWVSLSSSSPYVLCYKCLKGSTVARHPEKETWDAVKIVLFCFILLIQVETFKAKNIKRVYWYTVLDQLFKMVNLTIIKCFYFSDVMNWKWPCLFNLPGVLHSYFHKWSIFCMQLNESKRMS